MPYAPRTYPLTPMPQPQDPLSSLSNLMAVGSQLENWQENRRRRDTEQRVTAAFNAAKGNPETAAELLESQGDFSSAIGLREKAAEIRRGLVDQVSTRLNQNKTIFGQSAQFLKEIEAKPELYPDLRPKLVELATALDPRLAQEIPEAYEPERVRGMLQFVEGGASVIDSRARAAAAAKAALDEREARIKDLTAGRKVVSDWFSVSDSQDDWDQSWNAMRGLVPDEVLDQVGPTWSKEAQERARQMGLTPKERQETKPNTIQAAILRAREDGDEPAVKGLLELEKAFQAAGRAPRSTSETVSAEEVQALIKYPSIWNELTPSKRDAMLVPLSRAGFDFSGAATTLTAAQKGTIERWKEDAISDLNRRRKDPVQGLTDAEYETEKARIDSSYQMQMGSAAPKASSGPSRGRQMVDSLRPGGQPVAPAAPAAPAASAPVSQPAAPRGRSVTLNGKPVEITDKPTVGKVIELKDGRFVLVTEVDAQGRFDGDELTASK